tara:strand:+ start:8292 stop:8990 length:699 start_codon:yes stop_codon:yes gene_type:complete
MIIDWLEKGPLDLEYKQYRLLAYLKEVDMDWNQYLLYPHLSNVVEYNRLLNLISKNKTEIEELFPKDIVGIDLDTKKLIYEVKDQPNINMGEDIQEIIDWGIKCLDEYSQIGIIIYEDIAEDIHVNRIGLESNVKDEGYIIFFDETVNIYYFNIGKILIDVNGGKYLFTKKIKEFKRKSFQTPNDVKLELLKEGKHLSIPDFYSVEGHRPYPLEETVLPMVKRKILVHSNNT